jgi:hypothetical protein
MNWLKTFWERLRLLWQRRELKKDIDEELRLHLELRTAENIAAWIPARRGGSLRGRRPKQSQTQPVIRLLSAFGGLQADSQ